MLKRHQEGTAGGRQALYLLTQFGFGITYKRCPRAGTMDVQLRSRSAFASGASGLKESATLKDSVPISSSPNQR